MITTEQAQILCDLIEEATEQNWRFVAARLLDRGYTGREIADAANALAVMAGRTEILDEGDF